MDNKTDKLPESHRNRRKVSAPFKLPFIAQSLCLGVLPFNVQASAIGAPQRAPCVPSDTLPYINWHNFSAQQALSPPNARLRPSFTRSFVITFIASFPRSFIKSLSSHEFIVRRKYFY